jgi:hypothetical protein
MKSSDENGGVQSTPRGELTPPELSVLFCPEVGLLSNFTKRFLKILAEFFLHFCKPAWAEETVAVRVGSLSVEVDDAEELSSRADDGVEARHEGVVLFRSASPDVAFFFVPDEQPLI